MNKDKSYYYLMILNAHGGLIYHKNFLKKEINTDDFMKLASIFYTIEALSSTIVPEEVLSKEKKGELDFLNTNQLDTLMTDTFALNCFHALTGLKLVLVSNVTVIDGISLLKNVYEIYSDFVSKDPFYTIDQPIRSLNFDKEICKFFGETN